MKTIATRAKKLQGTCIQDIRDPPVLTHSVNIPAFVFFSVSVFFVCLFVRLLLFGIDTGGDPQLLWYNVYMYVYMCGSLWHMVAQKEAE